MCNDEDKCINRRHKNSPCKFLGMVWTGALIFIIVQFKWTAIMMIIAMMVGNLSIVLVSTGFWTMAWAMGIVALTCQLVPSLLSTLIIPIKVTLMSEWNEGASTSRLEMRSSSGTFKQKLQVTLSDEDKWEAFVDWMYREFSSEAVLSFLEFIQFRKYVKEQIEKTNGSDIIDGDSDPYDFTLYDGMPKSSIVYEPGQFNEGVSQEVTLSCLVKVSSLSKDTDSGAAPAENTLIKCQRIAHLFFSKYIDYHSVHEINISGPLRNKYVKLEQSQYDGMNLKQFVTMYDEVISEMMKYQAESYRRFERANGQ